MSEANKPFVVNDRRKFTMDGSLRPDAELAQPETATISQPAAVEPVRSAELAAPEPELEEATSAEDLPDLRSPSTEQMEQSRIAYQATAERLDVAIRAANPGLDHPPAMNFEQLVQSVYMTAIMQLGGGGADDQQPRVDLLGARQSIDMLGVLSDRTAGNLSAEEKKLLDGAVFDARLAFLEVTQALARSAAASQGGSPSRPSIVR